ncbi:serine hydrolase domain-containing protein [Bernardetia sp. MNP-M8]|uniref:serine hydrolase domain-containing protein n=1 Tax=Bernardetia sp. MNP-M8 TaxID=3127470 RepID=UPI0030D44089
MQLPYFSLLIFVVLIFSNCKNQKVVQTNDDYLLAIDSVIESDSVKPFNGVVLIVREGKEIYSKTKGFSDRDKKIPLTLKNQFVIGSISKQITAVMILEEYEKGTLKLEQTIRTYLPNLEQSWADSVTIHHLLTHTHGIKELNQPLAFPLGSRFDYSQLGFELLSNILESIKKQSFETISNDFFQRIGLKNTVYPSLKKQKKMTKGYTEQENGDIIYETNTFKNYVAAGGFISTAYDLVKWNKLLHSGKILKKDTFKLMVQRYETRKHPIFDEIDYGYGLTFKKNEQTIQIGALGFAAGFVSSNFYFPQTKTSLIVLENTAYQLQDFKKTFYHHTTLLEIVKNGKNNTKNNNTQSN